MEFLLAEHATVPVLKRAHKRYVGARVGIYNPVGEKVGRVGHLKNKEFLYVVVLPVVDWTPDRLNRPEVRDSEPADAEQVQLGLFAAKS